MTNRNWTGGTHRFTDPDAWTPAGTPTAGDSLRIGSGTSDARGTVLAGLSIRLSDPTDISPVQHRSPSLLVGNTVIAPDTSIVAQAAQFSDVDASMVVKGFTVDAGTVEVAPNSHATSTLTIRIGNALFENLGTLHDYGAGNGSSELDVEAKTPHSLFRNDGQILVGQTATLDADVLGLGTIDLAREYVSLPTVEAVREVGRGQVVDFAGDGRDSSGKLVLDDVADFHGRVRNFGVGIGSTDEIQLSGVDITSFVYQGDSNAGVLQLKSECGTVGRIHFLGSYTTDSFQIAHAGGDSIVELKTTT